MMRVLLFGASGFIGGHVRRELETEADLVCPSRGECDLVTATPEALRALLGTVRPDAVVSCAGAVSGEAADLVRANTMATARLVGAVADAAPGARLVRLGSAAEYGPVPFGTAAVEDLPPAPVSAYGVSQAAATRLVELAAAAGRVDAVVLRVFNPVGPGMPHTTLLGRVAALLSHLTPGGDLRTGPLGAYRDFVDVRDVAAAVGRAVTVTAPQSRVLNVASGRAVPVRDAVQLLVSVSGRSVHVREDRPPSPRSADVDWICADVGRSASVLGWTPDLDLSDSVGALWSQTAPAATPAR
ncbi:MULTISPECIES: NAD-dependent epimerase/dehydratase family protein [unclassified Micromonospora]|uniref:NAD-dependent epimerase/dehydratase family protein n=1 Tax=unclassified Micromonospora TaxID=2617518 RepID=UPI001C21B522|nr:MULTISPECIES: NAD-dependent epimerase/dehydratase family protein [unclassified Micromonospora]MBU8859918.1 NAD-dependent epimerase/dehydratase family protein [Micromonospora sp. WMMB482]MDM4779442.1 NAD-dependent epimerase/dehydratase family protein [Micromonospora sp. b486]